MANSRAEFAVRGVDSEDDAQAIQADLEDREGVQLVEIDAGSGTVEIRYGEELIGEQELRDAVEELGYEVE